jgi:hypothetical protein
MRSSLEIVNTLNEKEWLIKNYIVSNRKKQFMSQWQ